MTLFQHMFRHKNDSPCKPKTRKRAAQPTLQGKPFVCEVCQKGFSQKSVFQMHCLMHKSERNFSCEICEEGFPFLSYLQKHCLLKHSNKLCSGKKIKLVDHRLKKKESSEECEEACKVSKQMNSLRTSTDEMCDKSTTEKTDLQKHCLTNANQKQLLHNICNNGLDGQVSFDVYKQNSEVQENKPLDDILNHKSKEPMADDVFGKQVHCEDSIQEHGDTALKEEHFSCEICNEGFPNEDDLQKHCWSLHAEQMVFACEMCTKVFAQKSNYDAHCKKHREWSFVCEVCTKEFTQKENYDAHCLVHRESSSMQEFVCEVCGKQFTQKRNYEAHCEWHLDGMYICEVCDKQFNCKKHYKAHCKVHQEKKPFICKDCGKCLTTARNLTNHVRKHFVPGSEKRRKAGGCQEFTCDVCSKSFSLKIAFLSHQMSHRSQKLNCEVCNKEFTSNKNLKLHFRTHSDERFFHCEVCSKGFKHKHQLVRHYIVHTDEYPYVCEVCNKGFKHKCSLKYHTFLHTEERPFLCKICNKGYTQKTSLLYHELVNHSTKDTSNCDSTHKHQVSLHAAETSFVCEVRDKSIKQESKSTKHSVVHDDDMHKDHSKAEIGLEKFFGGSDRDSIRDELSRESSQGYRTHSAFEESEQRFPTEQPFGESSQKIVAEKSFEESSQRIKIEASFEKSTQEGTLKVKESTQEIVIKVEESSTNFLAEALESSEKIVGETPLEELGCENVTETPFICEICNKGFRLKSYLRKHSNLHAKGRIIKCEWCNKIFSQKSNLKRHLLVHTSHKGFSLKDYLKLHSLEHLSEIK